MNQDDLKTYLETAIDKWRRKRVGATMLGKDDAALAALCYVDAFQSVYFSVFGKTVPVDLGLSIELSSRELELFTDPQE